MPVWLPKDFIPGEVQHAVALIKERRHDLWDRWLEHERRDEGYGDISRELTVFLYAEFTRRIDWFTTGDLNRLMFQVRREVRKESGMPLYDEELQKLLPSRVHPRWLE